MSDEANYYNRRATTDQLCPACHRADLVVESSVPGERPGTRLVVLVCPRCVAQVREVLDASHAPNSPRGGRDREGGSA